MLLKKLANDPIGYCLDSRHAVLRGIGHKRLAWQRSQLLAHGRSLGHVPITVVMTCFQTGNLVGRAVRSVLDQTHGNLKLMVIDDASGDGTAEKALEAGQNDPRLQVYVADTNHGTYWSKNWLIARADTPYIATHDSDDVSHPERLQLQLGAFGYWPNLVAATGRWRRLDPNGETVIIQSRPDSMSAISTMFKRQTVLDTIGFYDQVRISADIDFLERLKLAFGPKRVRRLRHVIYDGYLRDNSLTRGEGSGFDWQGSGDNQWRQPIGDRKAYNDAARAWRERQYKLGRSMRLDFPLPDRPFQVPAALVKGADDTRLNGVSRLLADGEKIRIEKLG